MHSSSSKTVALLAFEEHDSLGVGYLASTLLKAGFAPVLIDLRMPVEQIVPIVLKQQPLLVGFSVIFQYHILEFQRLIAQLRSAGCSCHFTAGGHYPSLRPGQLLEILKGLDSVVLFEGEQTLVELCRALYAGRQWNQIAGLAFQSDGKLRKTPARPLIRDLDLLPPPVRLPRHDPILGKQYVTLLAGRGCRYNCTFCSIRQFYRGAGGPLKRIRSPENVVMEMQLLHEQKDASIFMFQDDDFPVGGAAGRKWSETFCRLLAVHGLEGRVIWKISCRPDEIEADLFAALQKAGLFLVYLGIESGTEAGLRAMNKRLTAKDITEGVGILKKLGIDFQFGYMLFDPSSTAQSLAKNLDFLEWVCGDGSSAAVFCKMLPYAETEVEATLKREGRLLGPLESQDYRFLEPWLDELYAFATDVFRDWVCARNGVMNLARWTQSYLAVHRRFYPGSEAFSALQQNARAAIKESNLFLSNTLRTLLAVFNQPGNNRDGTLDSLRERVKSAHEEYCSRLSAVLDDLRSGEYRSSQSAAAGRAEPVTV